MIDIHCHILPGLDDGPDTVEKAVAMAKVAAADGITHIIATPHVNGNFSKGIEVEEAGSACFKKEVDAFNRLLHLEGVPVVVLPGAEISSASVRGISLFGLGMNNTQYVLIEFPHTHLPTDAGDLIFNLAVGGYRPIIAHPERNPSIIENPKKLMALREMGALVQITASSLTQAHDLDVRRCGLYLVKKRAADFIASDAHSAVSRPPVLSEAFKMVSKLVGANRAKGMVEFKPREMINCKY